jgi:DNA-binding FadR family transcriptional regulator
MAHAANFHAYLKADMQFHRAVGQATHNTIITRIIDNLLDLLEEVLREAHGDQLMTSAEGNSTHHAVFAALQERDPASAATAMAQHITFATELWQAIISLSTVAKPR